MLYLWLCSRAKGVSHVIGAWWELKEAVRSASSEQECAPKGLEKKPTTAISRKFSQLSRSEL